MKQKEPLTLDNIKHDLAIVVRDQSSVTEDRYSYSILPITLIAVVLTFVLQLIWPGIAVFAVAAFLIVRYILAAKSHRDHAKAIKACLDRGDIAISVETLSHIAEETVNEPRHTRKGRMRPYRVIVNYYFESGASWRVPTVEKHYKWSKEYYFSPAGLDNISVPGNEFYLISLQGHHEIAYIYPRKFFELDGSLTVH